MSQIFTESWGRGTPVVLVHGSLAIGADEWQMQRPLAEEGFRLVVLDRRGYGKSPAADGEDFLRDADDIIELMGDGAHLVGHSYGGLGVLVAAARNPQATLSLALLEPGAFALGQQVSAGRAFVKSIRDMWNLDLPDEDWVIRFLTAVGSEPESLTQELIDSAIALVPVLRHGRPPFDDSLSLAEVAKGRYPKLVVSGGHSAGFDAICDDVARQIGAERAVAVGAGHEVQFSGQPINQLLLELWQGADSRLRQ